MILEIKAEETLPESVNVVRFLEKLTNPLMTLIVNITQLQETERKESELQLLKCKDEITAANAMIVKGVTDKEKAPLLVGKHFLNRIAGIGKITESKFREWRNLLLVSARCMDQSIYDAIQDLDKRGKEVKSLWVYEKDEGEDEEPHFPEEIDKKIHLILVNGISDRETKSLSNFMGPEHKYPGSEAWKWLMKQTHT